MIYLLLGSKIFFIKKEKEKKKKKASKAWLPPPMIAVGLVGLKAPEGKVESASPRDLSCFDIGAFVLSTKGQEALRRWRAKPREEWGGV